MRILASLVIVAGLLSPALADDAVAPPAPATPAAPATTPPPSPTATDDAAFDAQFQCPETIATRDDKIDELQRYQAWARENHPDWNFRKRMDVRYGLLRRHACAVTLANMTASSQAPFGR